MEEILVTTWIRLDIQFQVSTGAWDWSELVDKKFICTQVLSICIVDIERSIFWWHNTWCSQFQGGSLEICSLVGWVHFQGSKKVASKQFFMGFHRWKLWNFLFFFSQISSCLCIFAIELPGSRLSRWLGCAYAISEQRGTRDGDGGDVYPLFQVQIGFAPTVWFSWKVGKKQNI